MSENKTESPHPYTHIFCNDCGHSIRVPVYCKNRFCPVCSYARTRRVRQRLNSLCRSYVPDKYFRLRFLTLSVQNHPDARTLAKHLSKSFRNLRRRVWWKDKVRGGCSVYEVTGSPGDWHVHIHALLESKYLPWDELHALWKEISGGLGCWIQNISPSAAESYLTKYLTKEPESSDVLDDLNDALKGFRMFQPFGTWHDKLKPEKKQPYPCPKCGGEIWLPEVVIDMISRGFNYRSRSP